MPVVAVGVVPSQVTQIGLVWAVMTTASARARSPVSHPQPAAAMVTTLELTVCVLVLKPVVTA
jgi:hypothetical protein